MTGDPTNAGQITSNGSSEPDLPALSDLCEHALEFVHGAAGLALNVVEDGRNGTLNPGTAFDLLTVLLHDIRRQIAENCPEEMTVALCSSCLPTYNQCRANGGSQSDCLAAYNTCVQTCTP